MEGEIINNPDPGLLIVDMEGYAPIDSDKPGIELLLRSKFKDTSIDLGALADIILEQNYIGSVLKNVNEDDPDSDDVDIYETIYAFISMINLTNKRETEAVNSLLMWLKINCNERSAPTEGTVDLLKHVTSSNFGGQLGFFINERFSNMPATVSNSLIKSLLDDMSKANAKGMSYNFSHIIIVSKCYSLDDGRNFFYNTEESKIAQFAKHQFQFDLGEHVDPVMYTDDDNSVKLGKPFRRVFILDNKSFEDALNEMMDFALISQ